MPKITRKNPVCLHIYVSKELEDSLKALAARHNLPVTELTRRLINQGISRDAAHDATAAIESMVRRVIRRELKTVHDLAFRSAFNSLVANNMVRAIWMNTPSTWPLSSEAANALEGEIRGDVARMMRRKFEPPLGDEDEIGEDK